MKVDKPWGHYEDIWRSENIVFKKIVINPGHKISYQRHELRSELWYIQSGKGSIKFSVAEEPMLDYAVHMLEPGESIEIPPNMAHQLICIGDEPLIVFETQFGPDVKEEDIERIEDPYNRN